MNIEQTLSGDRDGVTFNRAKDRKRLDGQALAVFNVMKDGQWRTLRQIADLVRCQETSVSARLRDFRKPQFGKMVVEGQRLTDGLWRYRVIVPREKPYQVPLPF